MYHGKYDFTDFAEGVISDNYEIIVAGDRKIYSPNKKLKKYHTFLNLFWFGKFRNNSEVVYSYRKGVNVFDAVSKHVNSKYFFQTDIAKFFPSISDDLVRKTILENLDLLPVLDANIYMDRVVDLVTVDGALPVGFSTSPPISNACLKEFDDVLQKYSMEHGLIFTRYADDLIISSKSKESLIGIDCVVEELLKSSVDVNMSLHKGKTKFTKVGSKIKLLGMVILPNQTVSIDIKFKRQIEVILHYYITDKSKFLNLVESDIEGGMQRISGYLAYVNTVDKNYLDKLRKKYGATIVDMFLHYTPEK
jgi:RNA-directed DNA polymerase